MNAATPWVLTLALVAAAQAAPAQDRVYRCGASYSHEPCAGASTIAVDDARDAGQLAQARKVAQLDARLADAMARERLQAERNAMRQGPILLGAPARAAQPARAERAKHTRNAHAKAQPVTLYRAPGAN